MKEEYLSATITEIIQDLIFNPHPNILRKVEKLRANLPDRIDLQLFDEVFNGDLFRLMDSWRYRFIPELSLVEPCGCGCSGWRSRNGRASSTQLSRKQKHESNQKNQQIQKNPKIQK